jgi:hypothetical protein
LDNPKGERKKMSFKYGFLSLLALCLCLLAIFKSIVWTRPLDQVSDNVVEEKSEDKSKAPQAIGVQKDPNPIRFHAFIAEKNIFSPERKDFPIAPIQQRAAVRPQVVLYGVTIAGDYQAASIVSPGRPLMKGERETLTLKVGEKIGEYKLAKVLPDRITLQNTNDSFEVLLYDPRAPKKRVEVKAEAKLPATTGPSPAPAVSPAPQAALPATAAAPASAEKPKEPTQQQVAPLPTGPQPPLPYSARPFVLRERRQRPVFLPQTGAPTGGPPATAGPTQGSTGS